MFFLNQPLLVCNLVGGLEHFLFSHILGISSSQLTFIFFRGVAQPPTSNFWTSWGFQLKCFGLIFAEFHKGRPVFEGGDSAFACMFTWFNKNSPKDPIRPTVPHTRPSSISCAKTVSPRIDHAAEINDIHGDVYQVY